MTWTRDTLRATPRGSSGRQESPSTMPLRRLSRRSWPSWTLSPAGPTPRERGHRKQDAGDNQSRPLSRYWAAAAAPHHGSALIRKSPIRIENALEGRAYVRPLLRELNHTKGRKECKFECEMPKQGPLLFTRQAT